MFTNSNKNSSLSLSRKLIIRNIIVVVLFVLDAVVYTLSIYLDAENHLSFVITLCTFFFNMFIYYLIENWIQNSLNKLLTKSNANISKTKEILQNLIRKQKVIANTYQDTSREYLEKLDNIQNLSEQTKMTSDELEDQVKATLEYTFMEQKSIQENSEKLKHLKQKVQIISDLVLELTEFNQQISLNVNLVDDFSEQTNLLALNAAVEAARAGEHGKGFTVVAGEIRKLADESKTITRKITELVNEVQSVTHSTVLATEEGSKGIEQAVNEIQETGRNLLNLETTMRVIANSINQITLNTEKSFSNEFNSKITDFNGEMEKFSNAIKVCIEELSENNMFEV